MKWKLKNPGQFLRSVRKSFFLRKYEVKPETLKILQTLYPSVNWDRVDFYEGLPWFTPVVAPYVNAQALPQFYSTGRFRIYLRKFDESRAQCLADIVHEAFHVMQAMHFGNGYGVGFFRGWLFYYIAHFLREGYRNNVFEIPAYNQEYRFLEYCNKNNIAGVMPKADPQKLMEVIKEPELIFPRYKYSYSGAWFYLPLSFAICALVTVTKPVADVMLYLVSLPAKRKKESAQPAAFIRSS